MTDTIKPTDKQVALWLDEAIDRYMTQDAHFMYVAHAAFDAGVKAALAAPEPQPVQEPVAWMHDPESYSIVDARQKEMNEFQYSPEFLAGHTIPLYRAPVQPVQPAPLTDEQKQVLRYLYGAGELDGLWYGEANPKERGAFWWRKNLRAAFPISDEAIRTGGAG